MATAQTDIAIVPTLDVFAASTLQHNLQRDIATEADLQFLLWHQLSKLCSGDAESPKICIPAKQLFPLALGWFDHFPNHLAT